MTISDVLAWLRPLAFCLLVGALTLARPLESQQAPTFRTTVEIVTVHATVRNRTGRLVPGLAKDAFDLRVDGRPVEIETFANAPRQFTAALMFDTSESMVSRLLWSKRSALALFDAFQPGDRVRIGSFGWEVALSPHLTGDRAILERVLRDELWPGGSTPLWDALQAAIRSVETEEGRRAVLTFSDGIGSPTKTEIELTPRMLEQALESGVIVYAIGARETGLGLFREIAEKTGGGYLPMPEVTDLGAVMRQIAEELRHEYLIGFAPPMLDGRRHQLDVRVAGDGLTATAPRQFVARRR